MRRSYTQYLIVVTIFTVGCFSGCDYTPAPSPPPTVFEIDAMVADLKEIYYRNDYIGEPGMTATSDPEILAEFRRVVHEAQKTPLNIGDGELELASIWPLMIYDNTGTVREIKTADDIWTYEDKSIPDWIELKSDEFPLLQRRLIEHAAKSDKTNNSSQNQQ